MFYVFLIVKKNYMSSPLPCARPDLSTTLIHFTGRNQSEEEAFESLKSILREKRLDRCNWPVYNNKVTCFTEAPFDCLKYDENRKSWGFVNYSGYSRYSKFGVMFHQEDIYSRKGGTRVLYLDKNKHDLIPDELKWLLQPFNPDFNEIHRSEFAWEREWRIKGILDFRDITYSVIVPNIAWATRLQDDFMEEKTQIFENCTNEKIYFASLDPDYCATEECPEPTPFEQTVHCLDGTC